MMLGVIQWVINYIWKLSYDYFINIIDQLSNNLSICITISMCIVYLSLMTILLLIRRADQLLGGLWGRIWCDVPTLGPNMSRREQRARAPDWGENSYFLPLSRIVLPTTLDISCSPFPAAAVGESWTDWNFAHPPNPPFSRWHENLGGLRNWK